MSLVVPDIESITNGTNGYDFQAVFDGTDIAAQLAAIAGTAYVVTGMQVTPSSGMTVAVAAGVFCINGVLYTYAGGTVTHAAADSSDRRDIISITSSDSPTITKGTDCGTAGWTRSSASTASPPYKPAIPSGACLLAECGITSTTTTVATANIVDKTTLGIPDSITVQYDPSSAGTYTPVIITTGLTAIDSTNLKVVFVAPPSGSVRVKLQAFVVFSGTTAAATAVYFGVVSSTGSPGTLVGVNQRVYVSPTTTPADDSQMCTAEQVISGLTPGTTYTWYFAAAAGATTARIIPQGGSANTTAATGGPAMIQVTPVR